jgi:hypothetical protein
MNAHIKNARNKATDMYNKRDKYKAQAAPHVERATGFLNRNIDKLLMTSLVAIEIWQGESLDNIEEASNVSAAVDYDDYARR